MVAERPSLALVGTVVGEGESIAIFYNPTTKMTIRLRLGQTDVRLTLETRGHAHAQQVGAALGEAGYEVRVQG